MDNALNNKREIKIARFSLILTSLLLTALFGDLLINCFNAVMAGDVRLALEAIMFTAAMFFVFYGNILYHICLIGHYKRRDAHVVPKPEVLERFYLQDDAPKLSVIIPAYKEERSVNWQTMMSAALSEYPSKNVVLLIDDPYNPKALPDMVKLEDTRKIPGELQAMFDGPKAAFMVEQNAYLTRLKSGQMDAGMELSRLSTHFDMVSDWLERIADTILDGQTLADLPFGERFFIEQILYKPAKKHSDFADELRNRLADADLPNEDFITRQYARLVGFFSVHFSSFERKKYANLSHEANKAMNLNSYMSLIGKSWKEVEQADGALHLVECTADEADFTIPDADYINTIDSDSLMLGEYSLRLIDIFEREENQRLAVIQSPVSSLQGAPIGLERTAGACIDVQFRTHQGYSYWGASFWVGANAMLRRRALEDIKETHIHNGHPVSIYIQDRTVIEDTESTIDLVHKGWKLANYPERMTFSANPPDFGSLLIQRRRWSNGGLIILPKLLRYVVASRKDKALLKEFFMRYHYLASTTNCCIAAFLFMFYPFQDVLWTPLVPLATLPFLGLFIRDLKNTGYHAMDAFRIIAMNLMLLPIVAGGVMKMFQQIITGKKIPFGRTPKITGRTAAPALYSALAIAMPLFFAYAAVNQFMLGHTAKGAFASLNVVISGYALVYFVGVQAALEDMFASIRNRLRTAFYKAEVIQLHSPQPSPTPAPQLAASRR